MAWNGCQELKSSIPRRRCCRITGELRGSGTGCGYRGQISARVAVYISRKPGGNDSPSTDVKSRFGLLSFQIILSSATSMISSTIPVPVQLNPLLLYPQAEQAEKSPRTFGEDLSNRFHLLKVPNTDDVDLTATEVQPPKKQTPAKLQSRSQTEHKVWELIDEFSTDSAFIYCFFEDLHRIQDFLRKTWTKYRHGALDLSTCAMTTNLPLDLVRRAEDHIISQAPMLLGGPRSYEFPFLYSMLSRSRKAITSIRCWNRTNPLN